jgi:hypothetical protein
VTQTDSERLSDHRRDLTQMPRRPGGRPDPDSAAERGWFGRCMAAVSDDPGLAAGLVASLTPGHEAFAALSEFTSWPGENRGAVVPEADGPLLSAARALLDIVLAVENPEHAGPLLTDAIFRWRRANVVPRGPASVLRETTVADPRVARVLKALAGLAEDPVAGYAQLVLLALAGALQPTVGRVHVSVVFGNKRSGKLSLRVQPGGPAGLYPDPQRMAFFVANDEFAAALGEAWATSSRSVRRQCVLWDIADEGTPVDHVTGDSLAAAFGVGLNELRRGKNRLRHLNPRSLDPRCAITGALDRNGVLQPVGHYESKFQAAAKKHWRIVVPENDPEAAKNSHVNIKIARAADLKDAVKLSQRTRPTHYMIAGVVVLLAATALTWNSISQAQTNRANLRTAAAKAATEAAQVFNGDEATGLLLAMASDSIAGSAGERTDVFANLAENEADLVKIERAPIGTYNEAAVSSDGSLALIQTGEGYISLVDALNGDVLWSHLYPPGLIVAPGQVYLSGMALAGNDQYAAYGSSDGRIQLLGYGRRTGWSEVDSVKDPWRPDQQVFGDENTAWALSFTPDGRQLMASDNQSVAVYNISASGLGRPLHVCQMPKALLKVAGPSDNTLTAVGPDQALFAAGQLVYRLQLATCQDDLVMTLPSGFSDRGAFQPSGSAGGIQVVGTNNDSIVLFQPGQNPKTVATLTGLTGADSVVTPDAGGDLIVTASSSQGTFVFDASASALLFHVDTIGTAVANDGTLIFLHDGVAEIRSTSGGTIGSVNSFFDPRITHLGWAGNGDLVAGLINGVEVYSNPSKPTDVREAIGKINILPSSLGNSVYDLGVSSSFPLAAAVLGTDNLKAGNPTTVRVWNVADDRLQPLHEPASGYRANTVAFSGSTLLIGYKQGVIREFTLSGGAWTLRAQTTVKGSPISMSTGPGGVVYTLTGTGEKSPLTLRKLVIQADGQLGQSASLLLTGPGIGQVQALPDGGVITSTGTGTTQEFTVGLQQVHPTVRPNLDEVLGITLIPGSDEVMVLGQDEFAVLRQDTMQELGDNAWGRAGLVTTATADPAGPYFATFNFFSEQLDIWSLSPQTLKHEACAAIGANLTRAQWNQYIGSQIPYQQQCPA